MRSTEWLIHEPNRFKFLLEVARAPKGRVLFADVCRSLGANPAALGYHSGLLADAGLVAVEKVFNGITAWNWFSITPKGKAVLAELRQSLDFVEEHRLAS